MAAQISNRTFIVGVFIVGALWISLSLQEKGGSLELGNLYPARET